MASFRLFPVLAIIVGVGAGGVVWWLASAPDQSPVVAPNVTALAQKSPERPSLSGPVKPAFAPDSSEVVMEPIPEPTAGTAGETLPESPAREAELRKIEEAMVTYSVEALPRLKPYLLHSDAEVRQAARDALLQMGLGEASPILREAAERVKDPREAVLMLDLADYLDLPSIPPSPGRKRLVGPAPEPRERPSDGGVRPSR